MTESQIQRKIITRLEKAGWYVIKMIITTKNGIPDIMALKNGKAVFIEVKRPGEKPRPLQIIRHDELRMQGFEVYIMSNAIFEFTL